MEDKNIAHFVIGTESLLSRKDLTLADKVVFMRISGFEVFFESSENTAKFLGISTITVKRSKIKLEKLGLITVLEDTGHGKKYQPNLNALLNSPQNAPQPTETEKTNNQPTKAKSTQCAQTAGQIQQVKAEAPQQYGNADINWCFDEWERTIGTPIAERVRQNRYACNNLLKKQISQTLPKGKDTITSLILLVRESKKDRYAPRIADFEDLQAKMNALLDWATRKREQSHPEVLDLRKIKVEEEKCKKHGTCTSPDDEIPF